MCVLISRFEADEIGRIRLGNNRCFNMGARGRGEQPRIKTEGGVEGQQNCAGLYFHSFLPLILVMFLSLSL